jgi:hypothetical protein
MLKFEAADDNVTLHPKERTLPDTVPTTHTAPSEGDATAYLVRPEELAAALTVIEQKSQKTVDASLPLEQTLNEMQLPFLTEEVWNTIQARRQQYLLPQKAMRRTGNRVRFPVALGFAAVIALFLVTIYLGIMFVPRQQSKNVPSYPESDNLRRAKDTLEDIGKLFGLIPYSKNGMVGPLQPRPSDDSLRLPFQSPTMKSLADIRDGQVLTMDYGEAFQIQQRENEALAKGAAGEQILKNTLVETKTGAQGLQMVRQGHQWYLQGWTTRAPFEIEGKKYIALMPNPAPSLTVLWNYMSVNKPPVFQYADKDFDLGPADKPIQVPIRTNRTDSDILDHIRNKQVGESYPNVFPVSQLDKRAEEPWKPVGEKAKPLSQQNPYAGELGVE